MSGKMIEINAVAELEQLDALKNEYLTGTSAPLDDMWLCGFLPLSAHYEIRVNSALCGYLCINDAGHLLQFHLRENEDSDGTSLLAEILAGKHAILPAINGAFVSTAEPEWLSLCLDNFDTFNVNAIMYELSASASAPGSGHSLWTLRPIESHQLSEAVTFILNTFEAPEDWLVPYFTNLIDRQELFGCWLDGELIGTGENRKFDDIQQGYTELGMVVGKQQRRQGLATWIMCQLVQQAIDSGLKPICSTESNNIGAQKAITRAGFVARNRIVQFVR